MNTKNHIIMLLEENRNRHISGESIAKQLGISRNAVWKAVRELSNIGYKINAVTNKGYQLDESCDIISSAGISPHLSDKNLVDNIFVYPNLDSTNITAKEMAVAGAEHGTIVIADSQNAGKGRYNRPFFSPPHSGLYMSFVLKPEKLPFNTPTLVTALAAVVVCEAIEAISDKVAQIKWVNDIFIDGRKVCGISAEAVSDFESGSTQWIVVGIGINFRTKQTDFPAEIREIVTSVFPDGKPATTRNHLAAEVANRLTNCEYEQSELLDHYRRRLFMLGQRVLVAASEPYEAVALDIDEIGRLIIRKDDGEIVSLNSGEISAKPIVN